jgi:hypothetical protein
MSWVLTIILAATLVLFVALYRRGLSEGRALAALLIQVLLDEDTYRAQQALLGQTIERVEAKTALEFSSKIQLAVSNLAVRLATVTPGSVLLTSHALLWQFKQHNKTS